MRIYMPNRRRMITGKGILGFLSLFRYDIIYIKVRHKWFPQVQYSAVHNKSK